MKEEYVLVVMDRDYADEFNTYGLMVMKKDEWKVIVNQLDSTQYPWEAYFGTNEYHEFSNKEDYLRSCKVHDISEKEAIFLQNLLKTYNQNTRPVNFSVGIFPTPDSYEDDD
jgi:hypothetical protein